MAATETVYLRLDPSLKDRLLRAARKEKRSLNAELILRLERSLASGAGAKGSAGLPDVSAPVASDGALAGPDQGAGEARRRSVTARDDAGSGVREPKPSKVAPGPFVASGPASASPFVPDALKPSGKTAAEIAATMPGVSTAGDLARSQVTPLPKGGKR